MVAKLFHLVMPHRTYFGAKDYQQALVIRQMIADLNLNIQFRLLPTVREPDGLAMSSRNRHLSPKERIRARAISETLFWLKHEIRMGGRNLRDLRRRAVSRLRRNVNHVDYLEIRDPATLTPLKRYQRTMVALAACYVGKTRLIDNVRINSS